MRTQPTLDPRKVYKCNVSRDYHDSLLRLLKTIPKDVGKTVRPLAEGSKLPRYAWYLDKHYPEYKPRVLKWCASKGLPPDKMWKNVVSKLIVCGDPKLSCSVCGYKIAYATICSVECKIKSPRRPEVNAKRKRTIKKRYGVANVMQVPAIAKKLGKAISADKATWSDEKKANRLAAYKETMLETYGVEHNSQTQDYWDQYHATCLKNHGTDWATQSEARKKKYVNTLQLRYGVSNPSKLQSVKAKIQASREWMYEANWYGGYKYYDYTNAEGNVIRLQGKLEPVIAAKIEQKGWVVRKYKISIPYVDHDGKARHYFPDFVAVHPDGRKRVVEVKSEYTFSDRFYKTVEAKALAAKRWCEKNGADYVVVVSASDGVHTIVNPTRKVLMNVLH